MLKEVIHLKINWAVRFRNPLWWAQMVCAVFLPILAYFGLAWNDMTTWSSIGGVLLRAAKNPVVVVSVLVSMFNAVVDPTTAGVKDSRLAMSYQSPHRDIPKLWR